MSELENKRQQQKSNAENRQPAVEAKQEEKRKHSFGEKTFDWGVYGGLGFGANEILSAEIMHKTETQGTALNRAYNACENKLNQWIGPSIERFSAKQPKIDRFQIKDFWGAKNLRSSIITKPLSIFFMTIGGNLMVIPIRMCESGKDKIVHSINVMRYGKAVADSPEMQEMHAQMNAEPKQNWESLIKSRLFTLFGAIGIYVLGGTQHAPSTWAFNKTPLEKWSSLSRITASTIRPLEGYFYPERKAAIAEAAKASPYAILDSESKFAVRGRTYSTLFTISAVFAAIYYASTRIFAAKRDEKIHKMAHEIGLTPHAQQAEMRELTTPASPSVPALAVASTQPTDSASSITGEQAPLPLIQQRETHGMLASAALQVATAG